MHFTYKLAVIKYWLQRDLIGGKLIGWCNWWGVVNAQVFMSTDVLFLHAGDLMAMGTLIGFLCTGTQAMEGE